MAATAGTTATASTVHVQPQAADIPATVARLRSYFSTHATKSYEWRKRQLESLLALVTENEADLFKALSADLHKPVMEAGAGDIVNTAAEVRETLSQLKSWMKPESVHTPIGLQPASSYIVREPYGVMLLIAPFNYPVSLITLPLIAAIAAGNAVVIKPSELTPNVSAVMARLIPQYLDQQAFAVVEGAIPETTTLLAQRWDYIFFTGSETVGKIVAKAAAEHLTPVTLELGGKSPVIVDRDADVALAARRVTWGKNFNLAQTCIAPDYVFVHESIKQQFLTAMAGYVDQFYGAQPQQSPDLARIVSKRHTQRLASIIDAHKDDVVKGGGYDVESKWVEPTILDLKRSTEGPAMQEELFGPILPVIEFTDISTALTHINSHPKPLALYLFTKSSATQQRVLNETSSGGVVINDVLYAIHATHRTDSVAPHLSLAPLLSLLVTVYVRAAVMCLL